MSSKIILNEDPSASYSRTPIPTTGDTVNYSLVSTCLAPLNNRLERIKRNKVAFFSVSGQSSSTAAVAPSFNQISEATLPIVVPSADYPFISDLTLKIHIMFGTRFAWEGNTAGTYKSNLIKLEIRDVVNGVETSTLGSVSCGSPSYTNTVSPDQQFANELALIKTYSNPTFTSLSLRCYHQIESGYVGAGYNAGGIFDFQLVAFLLPTFMRT